MENYIDELIKNIPEVLLPLTVMRNPNQTLLIHEGNFELFNKGSMYACFGKIEFVWLPSMFIKFSGITESNFQLSREQSSNTIFDVIIENQNLFKAFLTSNTIVGHLNKMSICGHVCPGVITGNKETMVDSIRFEVANLKSFFGKQVKMGRNISSSRIILENEQHLIIVDKVPDFDIQYEKLKQEGGVVFTHTGSLVKKNGQISYDEMEGVMHNLRYFLSFINGSRTSPIFIAGVVSDQVAWTSYDIREIDQYKFVWSWSMEQHSIGLPSFWNNFIKFLEINPYTWLKTCLHWYLEANRQTGYAEGSIVMIQCALELLYNRLIERGEIPKPKTKEPQNAEINIRKLLQYYKLSIDIPSKHLNSIKYSDHVYDGPGMIVLLRNALVHSKETKRKKLKDVPPIVMAEILHLGIFYLEITLLKILGYKGPAFDRSKEVLFSEYL